MIYRSLSKEKEYSHASTFASRENPNFAQRYPINSLNKRINQRMENLNLQRALEKEKNQFLTNQAKSLLNIKDYDDNYYRRKIAHFGSKSNSPDLINNSAYDFSYDYDRDYSFQSRSKEGICNKTTCYDYDCHYKYPSYLPYNKINQNYYTPKNYSNLDYLNRLGTDKDQEFNKKLSEIRNKLSEIN